MEFLNLYFGSGNPFYVDFDLDLKIKSQGLNCVWLQVWIWFRIAILWILKILMLWIPYPNPFFIDQTVTWELDPGLHQSKAVMVWLPGIYWLISAEVLGSEFWLGYVLWKLTSFFGNSWDLGSYFLSKFFLVFAILLVLIQLVAEKIQEKGK